MLGKLMKHELKATSRLLVPLYIALFSISMINHFTFNYGTNQGIITTISGILFVLQSLLTMIIITGTVVFMIIRFYKNFLSDEGYLMFTLPVNTHQLILSEVIISLLWVVISSIIAIASWIIVIGPINGFSIFSLITDLFTELNASFGMTWMIVLIELLIIGILFLVGNIALVYTSIAIGQLFKKYKIIASFVSYVLITTVVQILGVTGMVTLGAILQDDSVPINIFPNAVLPITIIIGLVGYGIFHGVMNYIFNKKLNLE